MKKSISNNNYNRGQALMMVVLTMFIGLTIVLIIFMNSLAELQLSTTEEQSERAFNVAESGIENILSEDLDNLAVGNQSALSDGFSTNIKTAALSSYDYLIKQNDTGEIQLKSADTSSTKIDIYWTNKNSTDVDTGEYPNSIACNASGMIIEKWSSSTGSLPTATATTAPAPTNTATPLATATTAPAPTNTAHPSPTATPRCSFGNEQQTVVLQPIPNSGYTGVLDTFIANANDLTTDDPHYSQTTINTNYYWQNTNGLLGFDLTGKLPFTEPIVIDSAALDIYIASWAGGSDSATNMIFGLLTKPFDNTATWVNAKTGTAWTTPGGDYSTSTTKYINNSQTFFNVDITQIAKDWYANRPSNQLGILTKIPARGNYGFYIASSEYSIDYLRRPKLTIKYSCSLSQANSHSLLASGIDQNEKKVLGITTTDGNISITRMTYQPYNCSTAIGPSDKKGPLEVDGKSWDIAADGSTQSFDSGITYMNKVSITIDPSTDIMLRVRPIYNNASIRAVSGTAEDLPIQQHEFQSGAQVTGAGESRALQVVRTVPQLPSIFDYVLFSGENPIVK